MTRITLSLPADLALWIKGYAAARNVSCSRAFSDILIEKRATLAIEAEELDRVKQVFKLITKSKKS